MSIHFDEKMFEEFFSLTNLKSERRQEYYINSLVNYCQKLSDEDFKKIIEKDLLTNSVKKIFCNSGSIINFYYASFNIECIDFIHNNFPDFNSNKETTRFSELRKAIIKGVILSIPEMNIRSVKNLYKEYKEYIDKNGKVDESSYYVRIRFIKDIIASDLIRNETRIKRAIKELKINEGEL